MTTWLNHKQNKQIVRKIIFQRYNLTYVFLTFFLHAQIYSQTLTAEQVYKKVSDAVVVIHAYDLNNKLAKQGSGVVISDKGYIVTNYHVLESCERLEVLHNKKVVPYVDIIGIDVEKDILILKIDSKKFPSINIGDIQKISIGQRIYAIGSPLGFENTISEGIISGLRNMEATGRNFIQISASISHGSSGGAVVNDKGELVGISTYTVSEGQNLNFAIPIDDVLAVRISSYSKDEYFKDFELFYKGYTANERGSYQDAISFYSVYIRKYPKDYVAYFNRGMVKKNLEDYRGSIQDYTTAIEINSKYAEAYNNRGIVKVKLGDLVGAIQDFTQAIQIKPNLAQAYDNRGTVKKDQGDYRGAIQDYNKAIEINSFYTDAYNNRGIAKGSLDDKRGQIQDHTKAIEINPKKADSYYYRGVTELVLKELNNALQDLNKAIEINPNYAAAYIGRGLTKFQLRDKENACLDFSRAGELGEKQAYQIIKDLCK